MYILFNRNQQKNVVKKGNHEQYNLFFLNIKDTEI